MSIIVGCVGGIPNPNPSNPTRVTVTVNPSSVVVAAGSSTTFQAEFSPSVPVGGSTTWSVSSAVGGTISSGGVYTSAGTPGNYEVIATWTPSGPLSGAPSSGSANVQVLAAPQTNAVLNPSLTQASGGVQTSGLIQNSVVLGQPVSSILSIDSSGTIQVYSGFSIPMPCAKSGVTGTSTSCT